MFKSAVESLIDWDVSDQIIDYNQAVLCMESHVDNIINNLSSEKIWGLQHPHIYTAGTSAKQKDLLSCHQDIPVYKTRRGGQYTYHGPGMRILYVMLNLNNRKRDVRLFIKSLEHWVMQSLDYIGIKSYIIEDKVGVWVQSKNIQTGELENHKIAAIGVRLKKWVSYHGISININPNLEYYKNIIPCGISQQNFGITSFEKLGLNITMDEFDNILKNRLSDIF